MSKREIILHMIIIIVFILMASCVTKTISVIANGDVTVNQTGSGQHVLEGMTNKLK